MEDVTKGVIADARSLVEDYVKGDIREVFEPGTGVKALVVLDSRGAHRLPEGLFDEYRDEPARRYGTANLTKIESLIEHVNRFKDDDSALFAIDDRSRPSITAVLNYHEAVNGGPIRAEVVTEKSGAGLEPVPTSFPLGPLPRFGDHKSIFAFPLSDEWKAWGVQNGKPMQMRDFANFLEDRIVDVIDLIANEDSLPEALQKYITLCGGIVATQAKLIEISRGLKIHEKGAVEEAINPGTGEVTFTFVSEHVDARGQKLNIPNVFLIAIPVFKHGMIYRIAARLRYRKGSEGGLVFWYDLWRADFAFDDAFNDACERVRAETDLPLLFGTPE